MDWYWYLIIGVILLIIICILVKYKKFKSIIYLLVLEVEKEIVGYKKGKERLAYVLRVIQNYIPKFLKWYFTEEKMVELIEKAVKKLKKKLQKELQE